MPNRLADETSPYLLQHKDNPVDWYPWGDEALERARELDRPILLSIGYSACHWCHVMEHESFEDAETAGYMNEHFVCIKVDREERPDVDAIYMEAVQGMTGHGGWPLTAFCDPEGVPFYGGTYFPPEQRHGMPSFRMVLEAVVGSWATQRDEIRAPRPGGSASSWRRSGGSSPSPRQPGPEVVDAAVATLRERADMGHGGFGPAPKFPPASALELLLARGETEVVEVTLDAMAAGGIHDQIGGGFARYSVDDDLARPPLREDALRQRAARPRLPARLPGARARALARRLRAHARLDADGDARPRGRLLLGLRRRLRGRRGQVLRLDAGRDPRGARRATPTR